MQPSSLVFVAIIVGWAAYLLPQWLRRRDALGQLRVRETASSGLRVLNRRPPAAAGPSSAPLLTEPGRLDPDGVLESLPLSEPGVPMPPLPASLASTLSAAAAAAPHVAPPSPAALAARRRVRVFSVLLAATAASWVLVPTELISWTAAAPATGLLLLDLLALGITGRRREVRRAAAEREERRAAAQRRRASTRPAVAAPIPPVEVAAVPAEPVPVADPVPADVPTRPERASERVARELVSGDGTWIPIPVPPPTYTLKPAAPRPEPVVLDPTASRPVDPATDTPVEAIEKEPAEQPAAREAAQPAAREAAAGGRSSSRPWDEDRTFADDLDLDAVLARRRAVNG